MEFINKTGLIRIVIYLIVGLFLLMAYIRFLEFTTLFAPARKLEATPREFAMDYEDVYFTARDKVRLHGWFIKAPADSENPATILFCHGNAGNISNRLEKIALFHKTGCHVFIFDYRGYGQSRGRPSEEGLYYDALAAFDELIRRQDIDIKKIVAYGASLGGAVAIDLAARRPVAALIVDSSFTCGADMAKIVVPFIPPCLLSVKLDNIDKVRELFIPKLFIHSPQDEIVPYALGRKLYDAAPEPKSFLKIGGDHNEGFFFSEQDIAEAVKDFLAHHFEW